MFWFTTHWENYPKFLDFNRYYLTLIPPGTPLFPLGMLKSSENFKRVVWAIETTGHRTGRMAIFSLSVKLAQVSRKLSTIVA